MNKFLLAFHLFLRKDLLNANKMHIFQYVHLKILAFREVIYAHPQSYREIFIIFHRMLVLVNFVRNGFSKFRQWFRVNNQRKILSEGTGSINLCSKE